MHLLDLEILEQLVSLSLIHKNVKGANSTLRHSPMTSAEISEKWLFYSGSRILPVKQNLLETIPLSSLLKVC